MRRYDQTEEDVQNRIKSRYERDLPITQAAMIRLVDLLGKKSVKVFWFAAGKQDVTVMLKDCKMFAESIPQDIAKADTELGSYFRGAG